MTEGIFQGMEILATSVSNIYLKATVFLMCVIQSSHLFSYVQPFMLHLSIYLLKTSPILWSMPFALSPTHWSCKGWRSSSNIQETALIKKLYNLSHSKWYIFLQVRPWAWLIQLWVARWTFCCWSCFIEDTLHETDWQENCSKSLT